MDNRHYRSLFDLRGRVAIVTGAIGLLGRGFCSGLADFGASVAVVDLDVAGVSAFAQQLRNAYGIECIGVPADVSNPDSVRAMADEVERKLGPIDILHNNAATKGQNLDNFFEPTESFSAKAWREVMAVNLDGAFFVAREVGLRMAARKRGSIIQTGSIYGIEGPDQRIYKGSEYLGRKISSPAVYSASKAGIVGLTKYLAAYWGHCGVRVNTLTPGGVSSGHNDAFTRQYSARVPLGRMARADELVGALVFLASDASSYVTGQNIVVDGGLTAW